MHKRTKDGKWQARAVAQRALLGGLLLMTGAMGMHAQNAPEARFRGALTYDFGVTNVKWEAGTEDYSFVTFDLSWSYSWRAKWVEPAATSVTGKDIEMENWDAAWVFVKFLAEPDQPMNYWRHASLANEAALHVMPAGATNTLRLSDDGSRGIGVYIYRDAIGHGDNNWKGVKLRWQHGADKVDPTKAKVAVHPIAMVYVPEGPFKVGIIRESGFSKFSDGPDVPIARYDGEESFDKLPSGLRNAIETTTRTDGGPYLRWEVNPPHVSAITRLTDGGWRGGPTIPFLVDAVWNAPTKPGSTARNVGPVAGQLWSTHTFAERGGGGGWFSSHIGGVGPLNNDYPTGYEAFYCMKYPLTQGQYVDFLNSLAPDVAAGRAFVSGEISTTAGSMHTHEIKVDQGPDYKPYIIKELGGITITSSADVREKILVKADISGVEEDKKKESDSIVDGLLNDMPEEKEKKKEVRTQAQQRPIYSARCPFRRIIGIDGADTRAYAVWAGLRPMTMLENVKASVGPRDPAAPDDTAATRPDLEGDPVMLDFGLPTERFAKGDSHYSADLATRVGCRASPTSDRGAAMATYWGISELSGPAIPFENRKYRGTHGDGTIPNGTPGASTKRRLAEFTAIPGDWPAWGKYGGRRHVSLKCQLVASVVPKAQAEKSAETFIEKPEQDPTDDNQPEVLPSIQPPNVKRVDIPRVTNVQWVAGTKDYSTVTFDLAWDNSWRTKWEEPAEKNVTGKPLSVESWDAAWVFVKFREAEATDDSHATLSVKADEHSVPAGAAVNVGLTDDGSMGVGVFIYRSAVGVGANNFKGIKLRWMHSDKIDPGKSDCKVYALPMVYVPEGAFASRSPWGHPLKIITTSDARKPEGYLDSDPSTAPYFAEWPNGYSAFYCMKYSISQGQYADFLNSITSRKYNNGRYGLLAHNNYRRFSNKLYNVLGYTITTNEAGVFRADVPDRFCKLLTNPDILSFTAWAGLRPLTNLEYEKACRGPRAVARGADAWAPATCAPAAALDKSVLEAPTAAGVGPSYWGIRELSLSGCIQEWPGVLQREPPVVKREKPPTNNKDAAKSEIDEEKLIQQDEDKQKREYRGGHGSGSPEAPANWPLTFFGDWYYGGIWRLWGYGTVAQWVDPAEIGHFKWDPVDGSRAGRYGARAVRTAPPLEDKEALLDMDPPPAMTGCDVGLVYLSGRFKNTDNKPTKLEMSVKLPDGCFLDGPASRVFTAAPKAVTPFQVRTVMTSQTAKDAVRRDAMIPVQIQAAGGTMLDEQLIRAPMVSLVTPKPPVLNSYEGGALTLRLTNAIDRMSTIAIKMQSTAGLYLPATERRVDLAVGAEAKVSFPLPAQGFQRNGTCRIPYRITVAGGAPQDGVYIVSLLNQSRWWITRRIEKAPNLETLSDDSMPGGGDARITDMLLDSMASDAGSVFQSDKPPKGWKQTLCGDSIILNGDGSLPLYGAAVLAATRLSSLVERDTLLSLNHKVGSVGSEKNKRPQFFIVRVMLNGQQVCEARSDTSEKEKGRTPGKPVHIPKGESTLLLVCQTKEKAPSDPGSIDLIFTEAKGGKALYDLSFDIMKH